MTPRYYNRRRNDDRRRVDDDGSNTVLTPLPLPFRGATPAGAAVDDTNDNDGSSTDLPRGRPPSFVACSTAPTKKKPKRKARTRRAWMFGVATALATQSAFVVRRVRLAYPIKPTTTATTTRTADDVGESAFPHKIPLVPLPEGIRIRAFERWRNDDDAGGGAGVNHLPCYTSSSSSSDNSINNVTGADTFITAADIAAKNGVGFVRHDDRYDGSAAAETGVGGGGEGGGYYFVKIYKSASTTGASVTLRISHRVAEKKYYHDRRTQLSLFDNPRSAAQERKQQQKEEGTKATTNSYTFNSKHRERRFCETSVRHGLAADTLPSSSTNNNERTRKNYFAWSIVRDPTMRIRSYILFVTARLGTSATLTDADFLKRMTSHNNFTNFVTRYLQPKDQPPLPDVLRRHTDGGDDDDEASSTRAINSILESLDFLGVAERFDESVTALQMILGLDTSDVLYFDSKNGLVPAPIDVDADEVERRRRQQQQRRRGKHQQCRMINKTTTPFMESYLRSDDFRRCIRTDEMLYRAANACLDATIERLGRREFESNLARLRSARTALLAECSDKVRFPCAKEGGRFRRTQVDCVTRDWGCGFDCMDDAIDTGKIPV